MHMERKWVIGVFVIMALAMAALFGVQLRRSAQRGTLGSGRQDTMDAASLKELAAALKDPA